MVIVVLKNLTNNLRVLTDGHGTGGKQGIAIPGRNHGDGCSEPLTLARFQHCEKDIKVALKNRHLELLARSGKEERRLTYEEAVALLTPPAEPAQRGFPGVSAPAPAGGVPSFNPPPSPPGPPGTQFKG